MTHTESVCVHTFQACAIVASYKSLCHCVTAGVFFQLSLLQNPCFDNYHWDLTTMQQCNPLTATEGHTFERNAAFILKLMLT